VIEVIYVVDEAWKLIDMLELARFVLADPASPVEQLMDRTFVALSPHDDRERAVQMMLKYDAVALPVVDSEGVLLGVVTVDDVLDVAEEEATEDFQKWAAVTPLKVPYPEAGVWPLFLKRVPWLIGLVFVYIGASGFIAAYENMLASQIVLASFMPMLLGTGGNVGAQSGTLTVRALATGELRGVLWLRTLGKETAVGVTLGLTLAAFAGGLGLLRGGNQIGLVVAAAMVLIVTAANIIGMVLPYALYRSGADPAVASNPLITSLTDLTSLALYFTIATRLLEL
jgi:magnesium transporter